MNTFLITLMASIGFMILMALGVILSNKPLQGSCGGLGRIMGKDCEFCDKKGECTKKNKLPTHS